jgi:hypothetical protein
MLRAVLLSRFDNLKGPTIVYSVPSLSTEEIESLETVPKLIDIVEKEHFFIATVEDVYTANYYFKINNEQVRGRKDLILVSVAFRVDDGQKNEQILLFLRRTERLLAQFVDEIKNEQEIAALGVFCEECKKSMQDKLHDLFETVFNTEFDAMSTKKGKILVIGAPKADLVSVIEGFKGNLRMGGHQDLKTRMIGHALDEVSFNPFLCQFRGTEGCREENCPVCAELALESDAAVYVFDPATFDPDADFTDLVNYLIAIKKSRKNIPVLVMEVHGHDHDHASDELTTAERQIDIEGWLQDAIAQHELANPINTVRVFTSDLLSFKDGLLWLVTAIIA